MLEFLKSYLVLFLFLLTSAYISKYIHSIYVIGYKQLTLIICLQHFCNYKGDEFRTAHTTLGELHSVIPSNVHFMPLTATAIHTTLEIVKKQLSLNDPVIVGILSNRPND